MIDPVFELALGRARARYEEREWCLLPPGQITDLIYEEIRKADQERLSILEKQPIE